MKKPSLLLILLVSLHYLFGQAPAKISFQAVLRDEQQNLLVNKNVGVEISIIAGSESGHIVFRETHDVVTNINGMVFLEIGSGNIETGQLSTIKWNLGAFFVKTAIDPSGGNDYNVEANSEFTAVPYVKYADQAKKILISIPEIQTLSDVIALGDSAGSHIKGLTDPVDDGDLVTVHYLGQLFSSVMDTISFGYTSDFEFNTYRTIRVGTKVWMADNLRTGTYRDGTSIPLVTGDVEWNTLNTPGYCWYDNSVPNSYTAKVYGAMYNWHAVNNENLCPNGWRIPDNNDWNDLVETLGGFGSAGAVMKESGTKYWVLPNITNRGISAYKALPGGYRTDDFYGLGNFAKFWSANETSVSSGNSMSLDSPSGNAQMIPASKRTGMSVRCVRDRPPIEL